MQHSETLSTCKNTPIVALALPMNNDNVQNTKKKSVNGFNFVFLTVTLDMLAIGLLIPILPNLVNSFTGGDVSKAAELNGWFAMLWASSQFMFMPISGAMSDHFGRKPIFLLSNIGQAIAMGLLAFAPNLWILGIARIVSGIMSASVSTAYAYISDVFEPQERAAKFGILGAAFGLGFIMGPPLGGWLSEFDLRLPLKVAALIAVCNFTYGFFFLRESLAPENRKKFEWSKANPIATLAFFKANPKIRGFALVKYLNDFAHVALPATFVLYALHRFGWGPSKSGILMGVVGVLSVIVQGGLIKPIVNIFGEKRAMFFGLICGIIGFAGYGLANNYWQLGIAAVFASFWGVYGASVQTFLTSKVSPSEQGRLQGALGSMTATASIIAPPIFSHIFAFAISKGANLHIPGLAFLLSAVLITTAFLIANKVTKDEPSRIQH